MKLPNAEHAFVDIAKLREYCLSPTHPQGKHKAVVFVAALGLEASNSEWLLDKLLQATLEEECLLGNGTNFGQRYTIDLTLRHGVREARIRSAWIILAHEDFPRLVTCYVL